MLGSVVSIESVVLASVVVVVLPWLFSRQMEIDQCEVTH